MCCDLCGGTEEDSRAEAGWAEGMEVGIVECSMSADLDYVPKVVSYQSSKIVCLVWLRSRVQYHAIVQ